MRKLSRYLMNIGIGLVVIAVIGLLVYLGALMYFLTANDYTVRLYFISIITGAVGILCSGAAVICQEISFRK